jgi:ATP-binding cassette subfamily B protein/ATP-binding cassette subfamily B protein IrtA
MTVESAPLPVVDLETKPPKAEKKVQKQREALARKEILAPVRRTLTFASIIMAVASVCTVVPFVLIVEACRELLTAQASTDRVWRLLLAAVAILIVRGLSPSQPQSQTAKPASRRD